MNQKDIEDFKDMKRVVALNTKILERIDKNLSGDPDDRNDLGLIGDVRNNKRWKSNVNKALGTIGITSLGLVVRQLFELFKRGG